VKRNWKKLVLIVAVVLLVAIQLVPVDHSNETHWPWYSYVAPVSWLVAHDVEEGEMPLAIYRLMHSEARLSQDQLDVVREWATSEH